MNYTLVVLYGEPSQIRKETVGRACCKNTSQQTWKIIVRHRSDWYKKAISAASKMGGPGRKSVIW